MKHTFTIVMDIDKDEAYGSLSMCVDRKDVLALQTAGRLPEGKPDEAFAGWMQATCAEQWQSLVGARTVLEVDTKTGERKIDHNGLRMTAPVSAKGE